MSQNIYISGKYIKERPSWHSEDSKWKAEKILELIKRNSLNPTYITEVGCGVGEILSSLHQNMSADCIFNGYDISPQAIKKAKLVENPRLMFHNEDVLDSNFTKKWDILLVIDVIEHVEDIFNFLRGIRSLGRYKVFHIPLDLSVLSVIRAKPLILSRNQVGHIHYFNFELALSILQETGYEVCDYFFTNGSIDLPRNTLKSWALKLPRTILNKISPRINAHFLGGSSMMILAK
tara:strand:+ start:499 stop:1200 length:702 start_codon:yes stop_codon:yes gene_type:complete